MEQPSKKKQSGALVFLMSSSFFVALVVVVGMVLLLSPAGSQRLGNALVAPRELGEEPLLEIVVFNSQNGSFSRTVVTRKSYEEFYLSVSNLRSQTHVGEEMVRQFATHYPTTLTIVSNQEVWQVQFVSDSLYFRVLQPGATDWLYYHSSEGYDHLIHTLTE